MKILLVEDNLPLCENLTAMLEQEGYAVRACHDGIEAEYLMQNGSSDLVLLDRLLPGKDGLSVLRAVRANGVQTPVILLTALNDIGDKITGLDAGADDYIVKPFHMGELLARIRIWSRRTVPLEDPSEVRFRDLTLIPAGCVLRGPGGETILPKRLAELAGLLLKSTEKPLARQTIFNRIWGPDAQVNENILDTYLHLLRQRLEHVGSAVQIVNHRGVGYHLA